MSVSNGPFNQAGRVSTSLASQSRAPSTSHGSALNMANGNPHQAGGTPPATEMRAQKSEMAGPSTNGVAQSMGRGNGGTPPGLADKGGIPPGLAKKDGTPPGLADKGGTPPGHASRHVHGGEAERKPGSGATSYGHHHHGSHSHSKTHAHPGKPASSYAMTAERYGGRGGGQAKAPAGHKPPKTPGNVGNHAGHAKQGKMASLHAKDMAKSGTISDSKTKQESAKFPKAEMGSIKDVTAEDKGSWRKGKHPSIPTKTEGKSLEGMSSLIKAGLQIDKGVAREAGAGMSPLGQTSLHHPLAGAQQQTVRTAAGQSALGQPAEAPIQLQQQPGGSYQPTSHQPAQHQVIQVQAAHAVHADHQHHHGGLGVGIDNKSRNRKGLGGASTPLGQGILSLLFGMQSLDNESSKCALAKEACSSCAADGDGESMSAQAGGMSGLDQLLQLLRELVSRSRRISGYEKSEIFGIIQRMLGGDQPASATP